MLEGDALACSARTHTVGCGVDHFWAIEFWQHIEYRTGEHIATAHGLILEDAVVEQVDSAAFVHAQQRRIGCASETRTRFGKPDEFGQLCEFDIGADLAVGIEEWFGGQAAELETTTEAVDGLGLGVGVALSHALDPLSGDVLRDIFVHFN